MSLLPALFLRGQEDDFRPLGPAIKKTEPPKSDPVAKFETHDFPDVLYGCLPPGTSAPVESWPQSPGHADRQRAQQNLNSWRRELLDRARDGHPTLEDLKHAVRAVVFDKGRGQEAIKLFAEYGAANIHGVAPEHRAEMIKELNAL